MARSDLRSGLPDAVRAVLREADDSLQIRSVAEQLRSSHAFTARQLRQVFYDREHAGEFVRCEIDGNVHWTLNPEFVPHGRKSRRVNPVLPPAAGTGDGVPPAPVTTATPPPQAEVPAAGISSPRVPYLFGDRLVAIVKDLEAALDDACRAKLPHALLRHLACASAAANSAAREIGD